MITKYVFTYNIVSLDYDNKDNTCSVNLVDGSTITLSDISKEGVQKLQADIINHTMISFDESDYDYEGPDFSKVPRLPGY